MKKISNVLILVLSLFVLVSNTALALVPSDGKKSQESVVLANVDIGEVKIISTEGNTFKISFSISNGQGLQTGVKYGVELISNKSQKPIVFDEKVYEDSLSLAENSTVKKEITYTAPSLPEGVYKMYITSKNESSLPLGFKFAGDVKIPKPTKGIQISPESCNVSISGGQTDTQYKYGYTFGVFPEENIKLSCTTVNSSDKEIEATPVFHTTEGTAYGKDVSTEESTVTPIKFKAKETKTFSVIVPKSKSPKMYRASVSLRSGDLVSNPVNFSYIVKGTTASIDGLFFDKDYYKKGDDAKLSFALTYVPGNELDAKNGIKVTALMSGDKNKKCANLYNQTIIKDLKPKNEIPLSIKRSCFNPQVLLTIKDGSGNILDEKLFKFKTTSIVNPPSSSIYYIVIAILLLIIAFIFYLKKKNKILNKKDGVPVSIIFPFLIIVALFSLIPTKSAHAGQTFSFYAGSTSYSVPCYAYATASLDSTSYLTNSTISASGTISENTCNSWVGMTGSNSANGLGDSVIAPGNYYSSGGSSTYYTNAWGGSAQINFTAYSNGYSSSTSISYSVSPGGSGTPDPTVKVSATKTTLGKSQSTTISWTSTDATSCSCVRSSNSGSCGTGAGQNITGSTYSGSDLGQGETFTVTCSNQ